jgi:hypothetical protein
MIRAIFPNLQYHGAPIPISTLLECWAFHYAGSELAIVKTAKKFLLL